VICPYCNEPIRGTTERDYAAHLARCPRTPEARREGASYCARTWRDPRPEAKEALVLSMALQGRWGAT
jgi:hypothetical protein